MKNYFTSNKSGFTLIEIIVSLALFSVVVTIAVGALLILIASNRQLQDEQSVLSNLSFALDSMTREIRTGSNYYCAGGGSSFGSSDGQEMADASASVMSIEETGSCSVQPASEPAYQGISFDEGGRSVTLLADNERIAYYFDRGEGKLMRRLSGETPESIVSDGIYISDVNFYVTGPDRTDSVQPKVTIVIEAYNSEADASADPGRERAYVIQTTVTQRSLDI